MDSHDWLWLLAILALMTVVFIFHLISIWAFLAISGVWMIGFFLYAIGPETVSEISIWKASIKRDVTAAREIREEIKGISDDLRSIVKMTAENSYILGSSSFLAMANSPARKRLEANLNRLFDFVEPDEDAQDAWWDELQKSTFPERMKDASEDPS